MRRKSRWQSRSPRGSPVEVYPLRIAAATGISARTVSRILNRPGIPLLATCAPLTCQLIRAPRAIVNRYERERPGELVHVDVKKLGRIPDGGGWRAHGRSEQVRSRGIGFDYVHARHRRPHPTAIRRDLCR